MEVQKLKTFEDACKVLGLDAATVIPDFSSYPEQDRKAMEAHAKLVIIARAANQLDNNGKPWAPDWDDSKQYKYSPWFGMEGGSSGFRFHDDAYWRSASVVGSRLCFKTSAAARHVGKQFQDLYKDYFVM